MKTWLNIAFDRKFYGSSSLASRNWKRSSQRHAAKSLAASMRRNPKMRVLLASGCYDMQCKMGEEGASAFAADVREMVVGKKSEISRF